MWYRKFPAELPIFFRYVLFPANRCLRGIGFRAGWTARDRIVAFTAVCTAICRRRGESAGSITGIADLESSGKGRERICPDLRK